MSLTKPPSQAYRCFADDLRPRLLGRHLSLVTTNDLLMRLLGPISPHPYPGFYSLRSSSLLCYRGRVPPPLFFTVWGFVNFGAACCCSRRYLADDLQTPSLRRPKWVLLIQSRPKWVLIVLQTTCRGPTDAKPEVDPSGSCSSTVDPSGSCSSCRRPAGDLQTPSLGRPKWVLLVLR